MQQQCAACSTATGGRCCYRGRDGNYRPPSHRSVRAEWNSEQNGEKGFRCRPASARSEGPAKPLTAIAGIQKRNTAGHLRPNTRDDFAALIKTLNGSELIPRCRLPGEKPGLYEVRGLIAVGFELWPSGDTRVFHNVSPWTSQVAFIAIVASHESGQVSKKIYAQKRSMIFTGYRLPFTAPRFIRLFLCAGHAAFGCCECVEIAVSDKSGRLSTAK